MRATPWSTAFLLLLCGSALMLGGCNWTVPWFGPPAAVEQPIAFNHRKHAAGADGIKCDTCHSYSSATTGTFAGLPQVDTCMDCHKMVMRMPPKKLAKKPQFAKLKQFVVLGRIPWERVYAEPDYVYFSHRRHVAVAKLACANCHGDVRNMVEPVMSPVVNQSMNWCMNCHQQKRASQDCIACHK